MCDGEPATGCDITDLAQYDYMLNQQLTEVDDQFSTITKKMEDVLNTTKEAFIKMYRKDPRFPRDDIFLSLHKIIEDVSAINPIQIVKCESFSDLNKNVTVSKSRRSVQCKGSYGYCFINHSKLENLTKIVWTLQVQKCNDFIGKVVALNVSFFI